MINKLKEEFLKKAKLAHGNRYDYSKAEYVNKRTNITIICKIHGEFETKPCIHYKGANCPDCAGVPKITTDVFIKRAIDKYGDLYTYEKVDYKNNSTKVIVTCKQHGDFNVTPNNFLNSNSCRKCKEEKRKAEKWEEYLKKFKVLHNDKYDYSKCNYKNSKKKLKIICRKHGEFLQSANSHQKGNGCPNCVGLLPISKKQFIERAVEKHGDKYDFSNLNYKGYNVRTEFVCREHGKFKTKPVVIVENLGCNKCSPTRKRTTEEIIKEFEDVHGDFYDYSKVNYINNLTKVDIICPHHGEFKQRPKQHKRGEGCYLCGVEKSASNNINNRGFYSAKRARRHKEEWKKIKANLYYIKITTKNDSFYKIGITTWSIEDRFKYIDGCLDIIYSLESNLYDVCIKEDIILKEYNHLQYTPTIKMNHGNTECFSKHLPNVENFIFD